VLICSKNGPSRSCVVYPIRRRKNQVIVYRAGEDARGASEAIGDTIPGICCDAGGTVTAKRRYLQPRICPQLGDLTSRVQRGYQLPRLKCVEKGPLVLVRTVNFKLRGLVGKPQARRHQILKTTPTLFGARVFSARPVELLVPKGGFGRLWYRIGHRRPVYRIFRWGPLPLFLSKTLY
jgi:hypothetical protein